uniref:Small ribosomal subunit protein bS20c n=3 Tax=Sargassum TaxID=3015 RepID=A0A8K1RUE4_9PHAE|nr:30S ribosomal protein S20 [Sargassum confusum]QXI87495.1 ribosomal protein S20 [Sargassum muticum]UEP17989.1 ribosomal protein S20 [Sargassum kjellmanianum]UVW81533.1 30S ribosomal protein S20 [Sargassum siliquastrum]AZJ15990.1 30S ribosomal protein S20 [Sargassum confusum]UVF63171.1 30S ribosomal protein S20 [Sargassum confusum]
MANNKAAKKRIKINKRNNIRNNSYNSLMKTSKKKFINNVEIYNKEFTEKNKIIVKESLILAIRQIDRAAKKKIIHKNTAARKKSNLYKKISIFLNI